MSAQVTKEHCALWNKLYNLAFNECFGGDSSDAQATQLIADSEAEAVQSAQDIKSEWAYATMNERNQLRAERDYNHECINRLATATGTLGEKSERVVEVAISTIDQLRAEVERLRDGGVQRIKDAMAVVMDERDSFKARAERAEAELTKLRGFYDEIVREVGHDLIVREYRQRGELLRDEANRRKDAEAELKRYKDAVDAQPWASDAPIRVLLDQITSELLTTRNLLMDDTEVQAELADEAVALRYMMSERDAAEAELAGIRALADRRNKRDHSKDTTHQLVAALDQALDIAQAELATERARLRQLALDACRAAAIVPLVWYPEGYYVNPNDLGKINKQQVDACVAAIDAAMKEEAK